MNETYGPNTVPTTLQTFESNYSIWLELFFFSIFLVEGETFTVISS